jgi:hypothetical protein
VALGRYAAAETVLLLAVPWAAVFQEVALEADSPLNKRVSYCCMVFDVHMARLLVAWATGQLVGGRWALAASGAAWTPWTAWMHGVAVTECMQARAQSWGLRVPFLQATLAVKFFAWHVIIISTSHGCVLTLCPLPAHAGPCKQPHG